MNKPKGQIIRSPSRDTTTYIVPAGTAVHVANASGTLIWHRTQHENRFDEPQRQNPAVYGPTFDLEDAIPYPVSIPDLSHRGHHTFWTGNPEWPYMVVPKAVFEAGVETVAIAATVEVPSKKKLTKRQMKKMSKTHQCPDCTGDLKGGPVGGYESQSVHCPACHSKFFASAWGVERVSDEQA